MNAGESAGPVAPGRGGESRVESIDDRSVACAPRTTKISAGCLQAERSRRVREALRVALLALNVFRDDIFERSPGEMERAIEALGRHVTPGSPAWMAVCFLMAHAPRTVEQYIRRHPDLLDDIRRELAEVQR